MHFQEILALFVDVIHLAVIVCLVLPCFLRLSKRLHVYYFCLLFCTLCAHVLFGFKCPLTVLANNLRSNAGSTHASMNTSFTERVIEGHLGLLDARLLLAPLYFLAICAAFRAFHIACLRARRAHEAGVGSCSGI